MATVTIRKLYDELVEMKKDIGFIKRRMLDPDSIMTAEESKRFEKSMKEYKQGKTTSFSELKKQLRI